MESLDMAERATTPVTQETSDNFKPLEIQNDHLFFSLVSMLFVFPLGCMAVAYSCRARRSLACGNLQESADASRKAITCAMSSIVIGTKLIALVVVLIMCILNSR